jgi:hypothetical protein
VPNIGAPAAASADSDQWDSRRDKIANSRFLAEKNGVAIGILKTLTTRSFGTTSDRPHEGQATLPPAWPLVTAISVVQEQGSRNVFIWQRP